MLLLYMRVQGKTDGRAAGRMLGTERDGCTSGRVSEWTRGRVDEFVIKLDASDFSPRSVNIG